MKLSYSLLLIVTAVVLISCGPAINSLDNNKTIINEDSNLNNIVTQNRSAVISTLLDSPIISAFGSWPVWGHDVRHTGQSEFIGPKNPKILWQTPLLQGRDVNFQPTIDADGTIYVGTWGFKYNVEFSRGKFYAINPDGTIKWVFDPGVPEQPKNPKALTFGTIEASAVIDRIDGSSVYFGRGDCKLYAIDKQTGNMKWVFKTFREGEVEKGGQIIGSPVQDKKGTIYFGIISYDARAQENGYLWYLFAVNRDGSMRWKVQVSGDIWSSPAIADNGNIYFGAWGSISKEGRFYRIKDLGTENPEVIFYKAYSSAQASKPFIKFQSPAIGADGTIYIPATETLGSCVEKAKLYAFTDTGSELKLKWVYDAQEAWESRFSMAISKNGYLVLGSSAWNNNNNGCAPFLNKLQDKGYVYKLYDNGLAPIVTRIFNANGAVELATIANDDVIYFATRGDLAAKVNGKIHAINKDGSYAWSAPVEIEGEIWWSAPVLGSNKALYFGNAPCADLWSSHLNELALKEAEINSQIDSVIADVNSKITIYNVMSRLAILDMYAIYISQYDPNYATELVSKFSQYNNILISLIYWGNVYQNSRGFAKIIALGNLNKTINQFNNIKNGIIDYLNNIRKIAINAYELDFYMGNKYDCNLNPSLYAVGDAAKI